MKSRLLKAMKKSEKRSSGGERRIMLKEKDLDKGLYLMYKNNISKLKYN